MVDSWFSDSEQANYAHGSLQMSMVREVGQVAEFRSGSGVETTSEQNCRAIYHG